MCLLIERRMRLRILIISVMIYILSGIVSYSQILRATDMTLRNFHAVGIYRFFIDLDFPAQAVIRMFMAGMIGFILMAGSYLFLQRTTMEKEIIDKVSAGRKKADKKRSGQETANKQTTDKKNADTKTADTADKKTANTKTANTKTVNVRNANKKTGYKRTAGKAADQKRRKAAWRVFLACICSAGIYWTVSGLQTTGEWLLLNWNQGQRIVDRIQNELARLDEDTEIYYIIGGPANDLRNALVYQKTLQCMEPRRVIHLLPIENLPERLEGNYVYMSGSDMELMQAIVSQNKLLLYDSSAQCIYADEGTEAAAVLR
jgi:hypothetical protein